MFPSPGRRAVMALGHGGQHMTSSSTTGGAGMAASSSSTPTITFAFQPSPPPTSALLALAHHGVLGYGTSLLLDHHHPTTTTTTSSASSSHAASSTTLHHHLHGHAAAPHASLSPPTTRASPPPPPPHPWSTTTACEEGPAPHDRQAGQGGRPPRGKGAAVISEGSAALGVGAVRMKKAGGGGGGKARRKVREPRFCFKTMSDVDVLDDGYKWRKYGQKVVKNTQHPRSYYRCTQDNCRVKKRVERLAEDPRMVITTYEGRHVHSPSRDDEDDAARANAEMSFIW
ncbi:probable WRKY transcription factor 12 [Miscanthus floridulus]|uniref:probable WRKY transcription factor 12 n=1 Tax=Miscanthus floridulus TaxID=154761 RepID=UPI003459C4B5